MKIGLEHRFASIILSVNALAEELQYCQEQLKQAQRVIKQISQETQPVDEPVLIHPNDLFDLIQNTPAQDFDLFNPEAHLESEYTIIKGVKYEQSAFMPVRNKSIQ